MTRTIGLLLEAARLDRSIVRAFAELAYQGAREHCHQAVMGEAS